MQKKTKVKILVKDKYFPVSHGWLPLYDREQIPLSVHEVSCFTQTSNYADKNILNDVFIVQQK